MSSGAGGSGALPKMQAPKSDRHLQHCSSSNVQNSNSDFSFKLEPKPKSTCITAAHCSKLSCELRQTQSLNLADDSDMLEKSWSVLYIGYKD